MTCRGVTFYDRRILPWLINCAMSQDDVTRLRAVHVPRARGAVLEVGIGSALNLPFYTSAVTQLVGIDPSAGLLALARERVVAAPFPVELLQRGADRIPLAAASIDTAVFTWTLCSVANPDAVLGEVRRVLKPGGTLIFVEHGLAPDAGVRTWQNRLTPVWRRVAGGCHLNRQVDAIIAAAGFTIEELRAEHIPGPRVLTFMYGGSARKR